MEKKKVNEGLWKQEIFEVVSMYLDTGNKNTLLNYVEKVISHILNRDINDDFTKEELKIILDYWDRADFNQMKSYSEEEQIRKEMVIRDKFRKLLK